jgi:FlaA1/EpsC-like NDP-sugar epimerase
MDILRLIGRRESLFAGDLAAQEKEIERAVTRARVLVYGGAGSIGKEVVKQLFRGKPAALHVVDLSENNLVELVRDLRSSLGYTEGDSQFLPIDMTGVEMRAFIDTQKPYDYVLNLAALKHVRSEKDAFSLMRMIKVNVLDTLATFEHARASGATKYFAVSTDKAKNPANLMGATKRIMEEALFGQNGATAVSTARFANVAFSDGSLLHGFRRRLEARQPIAAPNDIQRYFITGPESGLLCLASLVVGGNREIFFPKLDAGLQLLNLSEIAIRFVEDSGYRPELLSSEAEARGRAEELIRQGKWPCYFFASDTSGEKPFEEFYSSDDDVDLKRFEDIGVIRVPELGDSRTRRVENFLDTIGKARSKANWDKAALVEAIHSACPELAHTERGKSLDEKM